MPQIDGDSNDVGIFHGLLNLDVLVREHLDLLTIVPEAGVEAVEKDG